MPSKQPGESHEASQSVLEREERNMLFIGYRLEELEEAVSRYHAITHTNDADKNPFASKGHFSGRIPAYQSRFNVPGSPNSIIVNKYSVSIPKTTMDTGYIVRAVEVNSEQLWEVGKETNKELQDGKLAYLTMNPESSMTVLLASDHDLITYAVSAHTGELSEDDQQRYVEVWVTILDQMANGLNNRSEQLEQQQSS